MKKLLFTFTLLLMAFMANAQTQINGIYYNLDSSTKTAEVTENPNYYSGSVSIPSKVTYSGYSYSVTSIGEDAFYSCYNLTSVIIPNSVTSIGGSAFSFCLSLPSVTIPNSVTSIGYSAFYRCSRLTSVTIPNSVTSIGYRAFSECSNLTTIKVDVSNPKYDSRNNCNAIIETTSNTLISGCKNTIIPNSVTSIGRNAFEGCSGLSSVTIPNSVTSIGDCAFAGCSSLTSIDIPNSLKSIGSSAFAGCSSLTSIDVPNSITSIDVNAFYGCSGLTKVNIKDLEAWCKIDFLVSGTVEWYDKDSNPLIYAHNLYLNDVLITDLIIPDSVTSIKTNVFNGCTSLTSVTIPSSVTSIGNWAFYYCEGLTSVTIPNSVKSIGNYAFMGCTGLASVTIPNSVTSIGRSAFNSCKGLTSITIPSSVTSIGDYAFAWCYNLTSVTVENPNPVTIEQYTFSNRANATLYVPSGSKSAYQAADYWKEFKEIIEKNMSHDAGLGDVNGDGEISISDVTLLVDYLLEQAGDNFILANADVNKDGRISVSDAVSIIKLILEGEPEPQGDLICPDGNHPHMIDLGLPSGTKWACCNVGADKPEAYGGYYAWGETGFKSYFDWSTYIHCDGSESTCHDLGSDIAGTQYDVAHVKWGGSWVMPSKEQQDELINNCTYEWTTVNGVKGGKFTSNINGGSIFLPAAGFRWDDGLYGAGSYGYYWSSTQNPSYSYGAYGLGFNSGGAGWNSYYRRGGRTVRPVSR